MRDSANCIIRLHREMGSCRNSRCLGAQGLSSVHCILRHKEIKAPGNEVRLETIETYVDTMATVWNTIQINCDKDEDSSVPTKSFINIQRKFWSSTSKWANTWTVGLDWIAKALASVPSPSLLAKSRQSAPVLGSSLCAILLRTYGSSWSRSPALNKSR